MVEDWREFGPDDFPAEGIAFLPTESYDKATTGGAAIDLLGASGLSGVAVASDIAYIDVFNRSAGDIHIEFDGTAATTSQYCLEQGQEKRLPGDATSLANVSIYPVGSGQVSILVYTRG